MTTFPLGDLNRNNEYDAEDIRILKELLSEHGDELFNQLTPEERAHLDLNQDGKFSQADLIRLCELVMSHETAETTAHGHLLADKFTQLREKFRSLRAQ